MQVCGNSVYVFAVLHKSSAQHVATYSNHVSSPVFVCIVRLVHGMVICPGAAARQGV